MSIGEGRPEGNQSIDGIWRIFQTPYNMALGRKRFPIEANLSGIRRDRACPAIHVFLGRPAVKTSPRDKRGHDDRDSRNDIFRGAIELVRIACQFIARDKP
jgi:hypothetical protein